MNAVSFQSVLRGVFGRACLALDGTDSDMLNTAGTFINNRMAEGWEWAKWPEWTQLEQRAFADEYSAAVEYAKAAVVFDPVGVCYYVSLQDDNENHALTETAWWAKYTLQRLLIPYAQTGKTVISGRIWECYSADPRLGKAKRYPFFQTIDGVEVRMLASTPLSPNDGIYAAFQNIDYYYPGVVFLEYGMPVPVFSGVHWSSTATYAAGDVVYYDGTETGESKPTEFTVKGECYKYDGTAWAKVDFPKTLMPWIIWAAGADLQKYNGQDGKADKTEAEAYVKIDQEVLKQLGRVAQRVQFKAVY